MPLYWQESINIHNLKIGNLYTFVRFILAIIITDLVPAVTIFPASYILLCFKITCYQPLQAYMEF